MPSLIHHIAVRRIEIPFRTSFRHSSALRSETAGLLVEATDSNGGTGYGEGCPRDYVTGETLDTAERFVDEHGRDIQQNIQGLDSLKAWMSANQAVIDKNPAAWCAVELSLLDLFAKRAGCSVEGLLDVPELTGRFQYSAVLGDADGPVFEGQLRQYSDLGLRDFKVKLSGDQSRDQAKAEYLNAMDVAPVRIRLDANNLWASHQVAERYLRSLKLDLFAIEEPLQPCDYKGLQWLSTNLEAPIVLDESLARIEQLSRLEMNPASWIINIRVSKMGGLLRSLALIDRARQLGIRVIIGAQVGETSLLTRAALTLAISCQDILLAQEGAFGTLLLRQDLWVPVLMFGKDGLLDVDSTGLLANQGLGLTLFEGDT